MADRHELARKADSFAKEWVDTRDMTIQEWFMLAWARELPELLPMPPGVVLNLGAGRRLIGKSLPLDLEHDWNGEQDLIPCRDKSVAGIWAHGFFEHISAAGVINLLKDCQRVLIDGGVLNIVTPHSMAEMYPEDITHKTLWHEATIPNILNNPYYEMMDFNWKLEVHTTFIMGVVWRNLGLFIQLVKRAS